MNGCGGRGWHCNCWNFVEGRRWSECIGVGCDGDEDCEEEGRCCNARHGLVLLNVFVLDVASLL